MAKAPCTAAAPKRSSSGTRKPPPDPYERLPDENRWDSILDLLGDLDPETANPYDLEMAEDYLLECLYQTDDATTFNTALVDLAEEAIWFNGHRQPQPKGPMFTIGPWIVTQDGDPDAAAIYNRHYSAKPNRTSTLFVGPGEKLVLVTPEYDALFTWRISKHRADGQWGAECTVFRNESTRLSSELIGWAENAAILEWPYLMRFYTFVDPTKVRSTNPGYSFIKAGWSRRGDYRTQKRNLLLLDKIFVPDKLIGDSIWPSSSASTASTSVHQAETNQESTSNSTARLERAHTQPTSPETQPPLQHMPATS